MSDEVTGYTPSDDVLHIARRLAPQRGEDIDSVTLSSGDRSVTLTAEEGERFDRTQRPGLLLSAPHPASIDGDYRDAPELAARAADLIARYPNDLGHLRNENIAYLWKKKAGAKGGKDMLGRCQSVSGLAAFWGEVSWCIWLGADTLFVRQSTDQQIEATLFHELSHLGWDEEAQKVVLLQPDFTGFIRELALYGDWRADLKELREAYQLGLWGND